MEFVLGKRLVRLNKYIMVPSNNSHADRNFSASSNACTRPVIRSGAPEAQAYTEKNPSFDPKMQDGIAHKTLSTKPLLPEALGILQGSSQTDLT